MMGTRSLAWAAAFVGLWTALALGGCSDKSPNSHPTALQASPGTVRVALGSQATGVGLSGTSMTFTHIDLLGAIGQTSIPAGTSLTSVPVLDQSSVLQLISWTSFGAATPSITADLPAGVYSQISLEADPTMQTLIQDKDLPFNQQTMTALLPISGNLTVQPGQQVTLFVDLVKGQAISAASGSGASSSNLPFVPNL